MQLSSWSFWVRLYLFSRLQLKLPIHFGTVNMNQTCLCKRCLSSNDQLLWSAILCDANNIQSLNSQLRMYFTSITGTIIWELANSMWFSEGNSVIIHCFLETDPLHIAVYNILKFWLIGREPTYQADKVVGLFNCSYNNFLPHVHNQLKLLKISLIHFHYRWLWKQGNLQTLRCL